MNTDTPTIQLQCHDVVLEIECAHAPFIAHAREHVRPLVLETPRTPQIRIRVNWQEEEKPFPLLRLAEDKAAVKVGKRLYRLGQRLLWTDIIRRKYFVLLLGLEGEQLQIDYDHYFELPEKKLARNPDYRYEKYFSLLKYFLYFPLIWYQEQFRERYLLHASGVDLDGRGIALGGVGGVGKTTTCIGLLSRPSARLLSENLIFYDARNFYQLYEPIRLDDDSVKLLDRRNPAIYPADFPEGTRAKQLFHIDPARRRDAVAAGVMVLPEFSPRAYAEPLSPQIAAGELENCNMLTREVNDYYWFAATLNLLRPDISPLHRGRETLQHLLGEIPAYRLGIDRSGGVAPVVETINQLAKGTEHVA